MAPHPSASAYALQNSHTHGGSVPSLLRVSTLSRGVSRLNRTISSCVSCWHSSPQAKLFLSAQGEAWLAGWRLFPNTGLPCQHLPLALANEQPSDNVELFGTLNELILKGVLSSEMTSFCCLIFKYHFKYQMSEFCVCACACVCACTEPATLTKVWPGGP